MNMIDRMKKKEERETSPLLMTKDECAERDEIRRENKEEEWCIHPMDSL